LGLLQRQSIEVARAHEVLDRLRPLGIETERFERAAPKDERRLERVAQLEVDALGDQAQRVPAIVGANVQLGAGKLGAHDVDDAQRHVRVVVAQRDDARLAGAGGAQHVEPRAVAVIDP
jgi:hypothetical protein